MHEIISQIPFGKREAIHQADLAERCGCTPSEVKKKYPNRTPRGYRGFIRELRVLEER